MFGEFGVLLNILLIDFISVKRSMNVPRLNEIKSRAILFL
jgi:hypothetical protein